MITKFENNGKIHFLLKNEALSCLLRINFGQVELLHFGLPLCEEDACAMSLRPGPGWGCSVVNQEGAESLCLDSVALAWSESGMGDYRESPMSIFSEGESTVAGLHFTDSYISEEIASSFTMPQARGTCETLQITMESELCRVKLYFSLFDTALTRRTVFENKSSAPLSVGKLMSTMMDLPGDFEMTTFDGAWDAETHVHRVPVSFSKVVNESLTGFSSNRHNPGFLLSRPGVTENDGEVFGFNLVYSGNHYASVQKSHQNLTRVMQGINPDSFSLSVGSKAVLESPEAVMVFSDKGFNGLRKKMHAFVNGHIIRPEWQYRERPVLFNSWEGCMFDFNEKKLVSLASKAKSIGCELFVLDDGWFGARDSDTAGLGDYSINHKKLPGGVKGLAEKIHGMGLQFGLWFEPEAVNPDSDLYRTHPDWAIHTTEPDLLGRNELLLDLRREEVRDYLVENVSRIIDEAGVDYVKWDMNRHSSLLGHAAHAYVIGLYEVLHRIFDERPDVLLESCSSGGNRFDLGMLCFSPQIWASDDTDPIERLDIQDGLFNLYPQSTVGAHVSASAHVQTLRATPLSTRANVSFFGCFGVELDLNHLLPVETTELKNAIRFYKDHRRAFQFGTFSKLPAEEGACSWQVSEEETLIGVFHRLVHAAPGYEWLHAAGLDRSRIYEVSSRPQLLRVGQFSSMVKHLVPVSLDPNGVIVRAADKLYRMQDAVQEFRCSGAALEAGVPMNLKFTGTGYDPDFRNQGDFGSNVFVIH